MITPSYGLTATERVLPRLALDFTTAILDPRITFTRTTGTSNPATYVNSSGVVTLATNNQPRFDFDPITLACKGLLIEESRANICIRSEEFNLWNTSGSVGVTANSTVAPDGNQTADTLTRTAGQSDAVLLAQTFTGDGVKAVSVWVKKGTSPSSLIYLLDATASAARLWCDVTWSGNTPVLNFPVGSLLKSTEYQNNWWRLELATTAITAANTNRIYIYPGSAGSANGDNLIVWGAQVENGAFATSYIPTTTASRTRNADVATMTGTNFSDWYNQSEGAFVLQAARYVGTGGSMTHFSVSDGTNLDAYRLYSSGADGVEYFTGLDNNVTQWDRSRSSVISDTPFKLCATYKLNNIAFALNGGTVTTDAIATIPTVDRLLFGQTGNGTAGQGRQYIQKLFYYPQSFTGAETTAFSK